MTIKNCSKIFMSFSLFITKSMSRYFVRIVRHSQQKNGMLFSTFLVIEFMCFLNIQNLEEKPPNINDVISDIVHVVYDLTLLNPTVSLEPLPPSCSFTNTSFYYSYESLLKVALSFSLSKSRLIISL